MKLCNKICLEINHKTELQVTKIFPKLLPMSPSQCSGDVTTLRFTRNTSETGSFTDAWQCRNSKLGKCRLVRNHPLGQGYRGHTKYKQLPYRKANRTHTYNSHQRKSKMWPNNVRQFHCHIPLPYDYCVCTKAAQFATAHLNAHVC